MPLPIIGAVETNRLLLVDDDVELAKLLADYLRLEGFAVAHAYTAAAGVGAALGEGGNLPPSLVILDVMLPDGNGVDALRRIRAKSTVPVLMLTARGDPVDRVVGLELGADDYVPKPCTPQELVARVRAILRRGHRDSIAGGALLRAGPLQLWPQRRRVEWDGTEIALTGSEFSLLEELLRHAGSVVGKAELSQRALGRPLGRFDRSIDVHVSSIRGKLGTASGGRCTIESVRGRGYQLVVE
jgi:two-component system OmpR family response regulator/two-component system response regulator CpxR